MTDDSFMANIAGALQQMSGIELAAVLLGIAYLLLAMRESLWCWYAALVSTSLFLYLFWQVDLVMESALQVYYIGMAIYGWWHWRRGGSSNETLKIARWPLRSHLMTIGLVTLAAGISGTLLAQHTDAALPYLDSFTTWGSLLTTWMVTQKILENWLYWLVIDSVSIYLYLDRELYRTAALVAVYVLIVIFGYRQWLRHYRAQSS